MLSKYKPGLTCINFWEFYCFVTQNFFLIFVIIEILLLLLCFLFQAIQGLNGMQLGEKKLIVQRASVGAKTNMNNVSRTCYYLEFLSDTSCHHV